MGVGGHELCRPLPRHALIQSKFQREAANAWLRSGPRQPLAQQACTRLTSLKALNGDASGLER
jgi:hypothetical protein